jgi:hypothetical protein
MLWKSAALTVTFCARAGGPVSHRVMQATKAMTRERSADFIGSDSSVGLAATVRQTWQAIQVWAALSPRSGHETNALATPL